MYDCVWINFAFKFMGLWTTGLVGNKWSQGFFVDALNLALWDCKVLLN